VDGAHRTAVVLPVWVPDCGPGLVTHDPAVGRRVEAQKRGYQGPRARPV